ncbi:hypothetical protein AT5G58790 [Arabidopsis thaliana]|uniref:Uncharacterized protein n=1 Tax=Arabidopsis thaliana TaxID=3702 RepID=F4KGD0_ARATH|nr:uncharacterized protein AT5G58790 [Arabidopsis thaliana]AED97104.1 hypothetical protein AT5G58790 [Arabidopsis thaliana]|eukprot:NP_001336504.1 hypothetical protein AT5G58790 [Arabidopsis thaliana]
MKIREVLILLLDNKSGALW